MRSNWTCAWRDTASTRGSAALVTCHPGDQPSMRPNRRVLRPKVSCQTKASASCRIPSPTATIGFEDRPAAHGIAIGGARCHMGERQHVSCDLQEFVIVELPCAKHPGALDAFANYRYQFLV